MSLKDLVSQSRQNRSSPTEVVGTPTIGTVSDTGTSMEDLCAAGLTHKTSECKRCAETFKKISEEK